MFMKTAKNSVLATVNSVPHMCHTMIIRYCFYFAKEKKPVLGWIEGFLQILKTRGPETPYLPKC